MRKFELIVSVLVPTYQQEKFIGQCLQSILNQKVDFEIEILVGDDCSSDATADVVETFVRSDSRVKFYRWDPNEGGLKNIDKLLSCARGRYIAILEGDDYWIDQMHLANAVSALDAQPMLAFTAANYLHLIGEDLLPKQKLRALSPQKLQFWQLAVGNFLQMGTIVYRRVFYPRVPLEYIGLPLGDYPLTLTLLSKGNGLYMPYIAMAYRVHSEGIWSTQGQVIKSEKTLKTLDVLFVGLDISFVNKLILRFYESRLKMQVPIRKKARDLLGFFGYALVYNYRKCNLLN